METLSGCQWQHKGPAGVARANLGAIDLQGYELAQINRESIVNKMSRSRSSSLRPLMLMSKQLS